MILTEVVVSGAVGKQVFATTKQAVLGGVIVRGATGVTGTVVIRDGNASGTVVLSLITPSNDGREFGFGGNKMRFDKGMHVKVIGASNIAYLMID